MIGCHPTRCVYSQHQGHHHLERYTSAIKSASGHCLVIRSILRKHLIHSDYQLIESKAFNNICENIHGEELFFLLLYFSHIYLAQYLKKNKTTIWLCIKN